jgi:hypothetical protein
MAHPGLGLLLFGSRDGLGGRLHALEAYRFNDFRR